MGPANKAKRTSSPALPAGVTGGLGAGDGFSEIRPAPTPMVRRKEKPTARYQPNAVLRTIPLMERPSMSV